MGRSHLKVFFDFDEITSRLSEEEKGQLLLAMFRYAKDGTEMQLEGKADVLWPMIKKNIDEEIRVYDTKVANGSKHNRKTETEEEPERTEAQAERTEQQPKRTEAQPERTEQQPKRTEAEAKRTEAEAKRTEAQAKRSEDNRNAQEKDNDKDIKIDDDDAFRAREDAVKMGFLESFGRKPNPEEISQICNAGRIYGLSPGCCQAAVRMAAKNGAVNPGPYAVTVLEDWKNYGCRTEDDVNEYMIRRDTESGKNGDLAGFLYEQQQKKGG